MIVSDRVWSWIVIGAMIGAGVSIVIAEWYRWN